MMGMMGRAYCSATTMEALRLIADFADRLGQHVLYGRAQPHQRLIQQQQFGLSHERPPYGQHLLLTSAQKTAQPFFQGHESRKDVENVFQRFMGLFARSQIAPDLQVLQHIAFAKNSSSFRTEHNTQSGPFGRA